MDIKERSRERMELRMHAEETLKGVVSWIQTVKPNEWMPPVGKEGYITEDVLKAQWRDYIDMGGKIIAKCWKPAELLVDDLTAFMEEICAKPKSPPESK